MIKNFHEKEYFIFNPNVVRINAIVASFEQFYEIYGIEEGDPMYVAPEDRLRLW